MSSESDYAYSLKYCTHFIVKNITGTPASQLHLEGDDDAIPPPYRSSAFFVSPKKTISIFNYPINAGDTRDLLKIPGIQEADLRESLLKGVLRHKFLCGDIALVSSNIDLLQFDECQKNFLTKFGFTTGVDVGWSELDGYVQGMIEAGGSGEITDHQTLRHLIHFIDQGPGDGFASGAYKEVLPIGNPFPTSIIWYLDAAKTKKLVEKTITYSGTKFPTVITWQMYATDGVTVIHTVTDAITYNAAFESTRNRTIA